MNSELTNLLPASFIRDVRQGYFLRVITVAIALAVFLVLVHGLLLIPSYLYTSSRVVSEQKELDTITNSLQSSEEKQANTRITALRANVTYLGRLSTLPTASAAVRALLAVPRDGIRLGGFTFTAPGTAAATGKMSVTGVASTRDSLRLYTLALQQLPFISSVDLPISAYAKESNIPFTITLTGSLTP
ncbi:MAG: hypothetical protein JWN49_759 [Parcubacteria group bacterium]|nr:hypothetical protein [Parcubacteria group bacterium]